MLTYSEISRRIIDTNIFFQEKGLFRSKSGGNEWKAIDESLAKKAVLTDKQILELSDLIQVIENHYGFPVDVEWAAEKERFYITQCRPITTLTGNKTHRS